MYPLRLYIPTTDLVVWSTRVITFPSDVSVLPMYNRRWIIESSPSSQSHILILRIVECTTLLKKSVKSRLMHDNERGRIRTQERFRRENWSFFSKKFSTIIFQRDAVTRRNRTSISNRNSINARGLLFFRVIRFPVNNDNYPPLFANPSMYYIYNIDIYIYIYIRGHLWNVYGVSKKKKKIERDDRNWNFNALPKNEVTSERGTLCNA